MTGGPDRPLRIVVVNWQDREHPQSGGAEVHLHAIFGRLAARGHEVRAVVGGWKGAPATAELDGIRVRRAGTRQTFAARAPAAVLAELRAAPADVVLEDINKLPLYLPAWVDTPVIALVPHLFGATAFAEASWPVAGAVWAAERLIPLVYRRTAFHAISPSTAEDLVARGIARRRITVIPPGIDHAAYVPAGDGERSPDPTVLYAGRLKRYKGLDTVLRAFARVSRTVERARLIVVGRGDDRGRLEGLARELGLVDRVEFPGYVTEDAKIRLLQRAWVIAYPSPKEGWGILNVEAAACGTPVVASDSPGLRDSVAPDVSGVLVPHGDVPAWAAALRGVLSDSALRERLGAGAIGHAARFSWDRCAEETETHIRTVVGSAAARPFEP